MRNWIRWIPAGVLGVGCIANITMVSGRLKPMQLVAPIESIPSARLGIAGRDIVLDERERQVAGMSSYIVRYYEVRDTIQFTVYVGYYDEQRQGKSIHSPRNCLPGAGWEPVGSKIVSIATADGNSVPVNRYHLVKEGAESIVYYWYQGRGRVSANEYRVKYELLRDAALYGRTEEALVRIMVPVRTTIADADALALQLAAPLVADVYRVLPAL